MGVDFIADDDKSRVVCYSRDTGSTIEISVNRYKAHGLSFFKGNTMGLIELIIKDNKDLSNDFRSIDLINGCDSIPLGPSVWTSSIW